MQNSDILIAQKADIRPIWEIAKKAGIDEKYLEPYGKYKAKIGLDIFREEKKGLGRVVLVSAINPTPLGEGKTTSAIGLADALCRLGKKAGLALREPSLGPVFGIKGGACGGGYAQIIPMEDINLHFTGDFHALGAANNLLSALIDNHIHQGNELRINPKRVLWKRCLDMNDRFLRSIVGGLGPKANGQTREDGFDITVASEIMAVLCLSNDLFELKRRLADIIVAYNFDNKPVYAGDLKAEGAMCALLKDAIKPNLVQSLEGTPALVHGGPFANIAHGCNSIIATKLAERLFDYTITEAGFGADLGAEKFLDIKCRRGNISPSAVVIVATIRALKYHGGQKKDELKNESLPALRLGLKNLLRHVSNIENVFGITPVVSINRFPTDSESELSELQGALAERKIAFALSECWARGGEGSIELARRVIEACEKENAFTPCYEEGLSTREKLEAIAKKVYHARGVVFSKQALNDLAEIETLKKGAYPVCVAKTQYSFSDNPSLLGAPEDFEISVKALKLMNGAGFIVALTGDIMTMPGLPKTPAACGIDVDEGGKITGLF